MKQPFVLSTLLFVGAVCYALVLGTPIAAAPAPQIDFAHADTPAEIKEVIKAVFGKNADIMLKIAGCESTYRQFDAEGNVLQGKVDPRDTGVFQFNTYWHEATATALGYDLRTLEGNVLYAKRVALKKKKGKIIVVTELWNNSIDCWG